MPAEALALKCEQDKWNEEQYRCGVDGNEAKLRGRTQFSEPATVGVRGRAAAATSVTPRMPPKTCCFESSCGHPSCRRHPCTIECTTVRPPRNCQPSSLPRSTHQYAPSSPAHCGSPKLGSREAESRLPSQFVRKPRHESRSRRTEFRLTQRIHPEQPPNAQRKVHS